MLIRLALALALVSVASILVSSQAMAASKRGRAVAVATLRVDVDLDASTLTVESAGGKLPGVGLDASLLSYDPVARLTTLAVSVRNDSDRTLLHDIEAELLGGPADLDPVGTWTVASEVLRAGTSSGTAQWAVYNGELRKWSMKIRLRASVPLVAGEGATIRKPGGLRVTVPEGAMPYEALVDVETVDEADAEADPGDMQWVGGVRLTLQPTAVHSAMPPPDLPFELRIASKQDPGTTDEYLVALLTDSENVAEDELQQGSEHTPHWLPLAHALAKGGKLRSAKDLLGGVLHPGTYGFFRSTARLYVRGTTNDAYGPRSGTIVRASHSPIVAVSDRAGSYVLAVAAAASVVVTALDPVRGQHGVAAAGGLGGARTVNLNVTLAPMSGEVVTRDGLRNGGFENDDLSSWVASPAVVAATMPLTCTGDSVTASEGATMASLTTVAPDVPASSLSQPIDVPAGVRILTFDYNVLSTEFTTGSPAPDFFVATVVTPGGDLEVVRVVTDDATGTAVIGDCGDGENWAETGWRSASIDLSALSTEPATRVRIVLSVLERHRRLAAHARVRGQFPIRNAVGRSEAGRRRQRRRGALRRADRRRNPDPAPGGHQRAVATAQPDRRPERCARRARHNPGRVRGLQWRSLPPGHLSDGGDVADACIRALGECHRPQRLVGAQFQRPARRRLRGWTGRFLHAGYDGRQRRDSARRRHGRKRTRP